MKTGIVALVGRPNSGKSTLLNHLLESEISIVTPKAQTTRDQIRGIFQDERGQVVFVDTPGIHRADDGGINAYMVQEARRALDAPDAVFYMIDPKSQEKAEEILLPFLQGANAPVYVLINKADLKLYSSDWLKQWCDRLRESIRKSVKVHTISAKHGTGVDDVINDLFTVLPEGEPFFGTNDEISDRPVRFFVSELVRKQLFLHLGDELPYSCAVEIDSFKENEKPVRISAWIYVERESQKGMVIGAGAKKIKSIGIDARKEIEALVGSAVHLELRVKVNPNWSDDRQKMMRLGYKLEKTRG